MFRPPRDWLKPEHRGDFGTRRQVAWLSASTVRDRGERAAAQEQAEVCAVVRDLMDRKRVKRAALAEQIGLSSTQFNQILRGESRLSAGQRCALGIALDFPASLELDDYLK